MALAEQLKATKLIFVTSQPGLLYRGEPIRQMLVADLAKITQQNGAGFAPDMSSKAHYAIAACNAGVPRVHVIDGTLDEGLLGEVFSNHGLGTLIYTEPVREHPAGEEEGRARDPDADQAGGRSRGAGEAHEGDEEKPRRLLHLRNRQEPGGLYSASHSHQRGILATIYVRLKPGTTEEMVADTYADAYANAPMIRLTGADLPQIKHVAYTNFCGIGWRVDGFGRAVLVSVIDNLLKGAASQAVQNVNVMFGLPEETGLL